MGTPEFPNLGKHCAVDDCKQIDFLPFTCDRCHLVLCLGHRTYSQHNCQHPNKDDVTVVICPLCAKGVRLVPEEDANITWDRHVNTDCDPSNYEKATKKKKCPAPRCKEVLVFSNTIKCRDCDIDHCLKHRFGPDHNCPGPRKPETGFQFLSLFSGNQREEPKKPNRPPPSQAPSTSTWNKLMNAASSVRASAEASMSKLGGNSSSRTGSYPAEVCPQCYAKFSSVTDLVEHVQRFHERNNSNNRVGAKKVAIDACPKCSKGFSDPVKLVEHMEREHGGNSKA